MSTDMHAAAISIRKSRVLTIHGTADATIPIEDGRAFAQFIAQHELMEIEGCNHMFGNQAHAEQMIEKVVQYVVKGASSDP